MMNMNYSKITPVVLMVLLQHHSVLGEVPVAELRLARARAVVGEPIVADIVLRNAGLTDICSLPPHEIEKGLVAPVLHVYKNGDIVAKWGSNTGCGSGWGKIRTWSGNCLDKLQPNEQLRRRALVVFMTVDPKAASQRVPLEAGRYTVAASIQWDGVRLETEPIVLDIVTPRTQEDVLALELVDIEYASFMGDEHMRMGINGMNPTGSVKDILEQCPESVHARLARTRLLALQAEKYLWLPDGVGLTPEIRTKREKKMLEMVKGIGTHLRENPNDPLELDLLQARVKLLRKYEVLDPLEDAIGVLIKRYPKSTYAEQGREMLQKVREYRQKISRNYNQVPGK